MHLPAQSLSDVSPDAIVCADADGHIIYWNEASAKMFGIPHETALGASLDLIVPEPMRGAHAAGMKRLAQGGNARVVGRVIEIVAQHADGRMLPVEMSIARWDDRGEPFFGAIIRDISERRRSQDRLHHLAHFDQLTLLANRTLFIERLNASLAGSGMATVMLLDLDRFKEVNDHYGHVAGDAVLCEAANRLMQCLTTPDITVSRIGGDEFAVVLPGSADLFFASYLADTILDAFTRPFTVEAREFKIGCSIGLASAPNDGLTTDVLIGNADLALYKAKVRGGCFEFYLPALREHSTTRRQLEAELELALDRNEFEVFYQPQVRLSDKTIVGAEALLRWHRPLQGIQSPDKFLAVLEDMKQADAVGRWILNTACRQAAVWRTLLPEFRIAINLFDTQVRSTTLVAEVEGALIQAGLPLDCLELEITENVAIDEKDSCLSSLRSLHDRGVSLAFDDYGTGYASLSLLKRFPLSRLKIDRSFIRDIATNKDDQAIVGAVVALSRQFDLGSIAEGIETFEQETLVRASGCQEAQGYRYGKPMSAADFTALLQRKAPLTKEWLSIV